MLFKSQIVKKNQYKYLRNEISETLLFRLADFSSFHWSKPASLIVSLSLQLNILEQQNVFIIKHFQIKKMVNVEFDHSLFLNLLFCVVCFTFV